MWGGHKGKPWGLGGSRFLDFGKRGGDRGGSIKYYCIKKCTGMRHKSILGLHSGDLFRIPGLIPSILSYVPPSVKLLGLTTLPVFLPRTHNPPSVLKPV